MKEIICKEQNNGRYFVTITDDETNAFYSVENAKVQFWLTEEQPAVIEINTMGLVKQNERPADD